jgi:hypothetical protein
MVDRHALASLVIGFGARPPAQPGAPPRCRSCWAPLRAADATVVRCVFCGVSNITGVDLRALAGRTSEAQDSLEWAMSLRNMARRGWMLGAAFAAVAAFATFALLHHVYTQSDPIPAAEDLLVAGRTPIVSPDGRAVVFRRGNVWKLLDPKTRAMGDLPPSLAEATALAPLGERRFVAASDVPLHNPVDVVEASGSRRTIARSRHKIERISIAPGGASVLVLNFSQQVNVPLSVATPVDVDEARGERYLAAQGLAQSPDGKRLAFSLEHDLDRVDLFERDVASGTNRALTDNCTDCTEPSWSSDGYVYYTSKGTIHRLKP